MPAAPLILGGLAAAGVASTIGAAVVGAITTATVSAAVVTAVGTGVIAGGITAIQGGDISDVLKSAVLAGAGSYVGGQIASKVSDAVSSYTGAPLGSGIGTGSSGLGIKLPTDAGAIMGTGSASTGATLGSGVSAGAGAGALLGAGVAPTLIGIGAGNVAGRVTEAAIRGGDLKEAALLGVAQTVPIALNQSADWRNLDPFAKDMVTSVVQSAISGQDVSDAMLSTLVRSSGIVSKALNEIPDAQKYLKENPTFAKYVLDTTNNALVAQLQGKDVSDAVIAGLAKTTAQVMAKQFKDAKAAKRLEDAQQKHGEAEKVREQALEVQDQITTLLSDNQKGIDQFNVALTSYKDAKEEFNREDRAYKSTVNLFDTITPGHPNYDPDMRAYIQGKIDRDNFFGGEKAGWTVEQYVANEANSRIPYYEQAAYNLNQTVESLNYYHERLENRGFFDEYDSLVKELQEYDTDYKSIFDEVNLMSKDLVDFSTEITTTIDDAIKPWLVDDYTFGIPQEDLEEVFFNKDTNFEYASQFTAGDRAGRQSTVKPLPANVLAAAISPTGDYWLGTDGNIYTANNELLGSRTKLQNYTDQGWSRFVDISSAKPFDPNARARTEDGRLTNELRPIDAEENVLSKSDEAVNAYMDALAEGKSTAEAYQAAVTKYQEVLARPKADEETVAGESLGTGIGTGSIGLGFEAPSGAGSILGAGPSELQKQIEKAQQFPGIFDASKYDDIQDAANAAAAVDENKFLWKDGSVRLIKVPETALNQIKNAPTFNEAFALAQKNLGEGNVFEWGGELFVNRTKEQEAALPYNGNNFDDRGAAAYRAHLAGKNTFTWGGNTWKLPADYASQVSKALGQDPNQSPAETKRLLDANIQAADKIDEKKIQLVNTGVPVLDQIIGSISFVQGKTIEGTGEGLKALARAHALRTGESFENALIDVGNWVSSVGRSIQLPEIAAEAKYQVGNIQKANEEAAQTTNPLKQYAIIGSAVLTNPLGYLSEVAREAGEDAPETLLTIGALATIPFSGTAATGLALTTAVYSGYKTYGETGYNRYKELIAEGKTDEEARAGGNIMGIVNAIIDAPLEFIGDRALMIPYLDGIKGAVQTTAKTFINPITVAAATEYAQELLQGVSSRVVRGDPQNLAQDMASATYASLISVGASGGFIAPAAINRAAQVALDRYGNPVTFDELVGPGASTREINLSTLDLSAKVATLQDGTSLSLGGLQMLLPQTGLTRDFVSTYTPDLSLTRNTVVAYGPNDTPIQFKNSQPFFDKYLISVGDIPSISQAEAKNLLKDQGRQNPTQQEIDFVIDNAKGANDEDIAKQVADPFVVSVEEIKQAAQSAGYAISDQEAQELAGEKLQSEVLPALQQQFNPLATTEQEVRQMFEERGYTPTQEEVERFIKSVPELEVKAEIQSYTDPRMLYPKDIKDLAAREGYEISDARATELSGQKDKYASLEALRAEFDAGAVTMDEARQMFANTPYKPTDEEIAQFIASKPESQIQQDIQSYVAPRYVSAQDIKDAAAQEGYTITDEQAEALSGQQDKLAAIAKFRADVDPQAVTEAEARAFFAELGYEPTQDELNEFVASRSEDQIRADISAYVDPRYVSLEEVKRVAAEEGYNISDEDALALTGQKSQQDILNAFRQTADQQAVIESEAREFFDQYGYVPTQEELALFVGSRPEADIRAEIGPYVDPRFVTIDEIKQAARAEGYDITDEEAAALAGQKSQEEAIAAFRQEIDPKAMIEAEALAFFDEFGYAPSPEELSQFIVSRPEDLVRADIQQYIDPRQVTAAEVQSKFGELQPEYTYTPEEIALFTQMGPGVNQADVLGGIGAYIDPRFVTQAEVEKAYSDLGFMSPAEQDIARFIGQADQEGLGGRVQEYLPTAIANRMTAAMAQYDQLSASQKAIADALVQQGSDLNSAIEEAKSTLGEQISDVEQGLINKYNQLNDNQKTIADNLIAQGQTLNEAITAAQENLGVQISDVEKGLTEKYNQLSEAQKAIADNLISQGQSLNNAINAAQESLGGQISEVETALTNQYNQLSEAQKTIADNLVSQGQTLSEAITAAKGELGGQISEVETTLTNKYNELNEAQKAIADNLISQGQSLNDAITAAQESLGGQISDVEKGLTDKYNELSDAQKQLADDLVSQGEDLTTAIDKAKEEITQTTQTLLTDQQKQILDLVSANESAGLSRDEALQKAIADVGGTVTATETSLLGKISDLEKSGLDRDLATQTALKDLSTDLTKQLQDIQQENQRQQEIKSINDKFTQDLQSLVNQGMDFQIAVTQLLGGIEDPEKKALVNLSAPGVTSVQQQQAQQKAAKKAAFQEKQEGLRNLAVPAIGGLATAAEPAFEPHKMDLEMLFTGEAGDAFVSPLAPYLAKVQQQPYTGEPVPTQEQSLAEPKDLTNMKQRDQGYFTYGQPSEIDQNLAAIADPFGYYTAAAMAGGMRAGGLVPPLMAAGGTTRYGRYAGGGLNLVPHTGKMRVDFRQGDAVTGEGDGQSDDIPAMLADGEFVIPADVVAALGNGSTKAGSDKLYDMMHSIRAQHRSADPKSLPPPAKSPLDYISQRPKAKKRK